MGIQVLSMSMETHTHLLHEHSYLYTSIYMSGIYALLHHRWSAHGWAAVHARRSACTLGAKEPGMGWVMASPAGKLGRVHK